VECEFFRKLLKGLTYVPRVLITDKLKSYGAAKRDLLPSVEHRQHCYLNNRAENSHQPTRYGPIAQHFRPRRHLLPAPIYREEMRQRFQSWQEVTSMATAA
jgi:putative transposase